MEGTMEGNNYVYVRLPMAGAAGSAGRGTRADDARDGVHCHSRGVTCQGEWHQDHRGRYAVRLVAGGGLGAVQELHAVLHQLGQPAQLRLHHRGGQSSGRAAGGHVHRAVQ